MIDLSAYPILHKNTTTLKETSKDDSNNQYMTLSKIETVNFDFVKRNYANSLGLSEEVVTSVDAVLPINNGILFIEFKNGKVDRGIKDKARDSLLIFLEIVNKTIAFSRQNIDFILVFNLEKNPLPNQVKKGVLQDTPSRIDIGNHLMAKAGEELILFNLERYKSIYFRNIHTYPKEKFEEYLQGLQNKS